MNTKKPKEIQVNEKQIEVYEKLVISMEACKTIIREFDGQIVNDRLAQALCGAISDSDIRLNICRAEYTRNRYIRFFNTNNSIKVIVDETYGYIHNIGDCDKYIELCKYDDKLNAQTTLADLELQIKRTKDNIKKLYKANTLYDNMMKDYLKIRDLIGAYNEKYDDSIKYNHMFKV